MNGFLCTLAAHASTIMYNLQNSFDGKALYIIISRTRPSFPQRWMYFITSTRKEGLGTLAITPWHTGMQSHDIVTRQNALNTTSIQICACVV